MNWQMVRRNDLALIKSKSGFQIFNLSERYMMADYGKAELEAMPHIINHRLEDSEISNQEVDRIWELVAEKFNMARTPKNMGHQKAFIKFVLEQVNRDERLTNLRRN